VDWVEGVERNNENQVMLKRKWLEIRVMDRKQWLIDGAEKELIEQIKNKSKR